MKKGFTLIEVLVVMTLIGILVAIMIPNFVNSFKKAREAVLKENLFMLRDAINKYYFDKKKYPQSLDDLVAGRYLSRIPFDPISNKNEWESVHPEMDDSEDYDPQKLENIIDVKSLSNAAALDGTKYNEW